MDKLGRDTFESESKAEIFEKYEWDDLWFQDANDRDVKRVLLIGDSITRGFRPFINLLLRNEKMVADQLATSKAVDNPHFCRLIDYTISQQPGCDSIHILLGAHGSHLNISEYENGFKKIIDHLVTSYPEKKILIANYHTFRKAGVLGEIHDKNSIYFERGNVAHKIAVEYGLAFVDLCSIMIDRNDISDLYADDGVHLKENGYKLLANKVYEHLVN